IELYKKSTITQQLVSPGYTKEILWYSTYFQGKLYVGTYPNAHLYRVNAFSNPPTIEKDLGSIGYPGETNEPDEPGYYDMKIIQAITSDNYFIYGGVSLAQFLFYYNPLTEKTHSFGNSILRDQAIKGLYDAVKYTSINGDQYIYFGTFVNDISKMKIVKWKVREGTSPEGSIPLKEFQIIDLNKPFPIVNDLEIGKYLGRDVLYIGGSDGTNESIFIYDLESPSNPMIEVKMNELSTSTQLHVSNFKADPQENIVWLFDSKMRRVDLSQKSISHVITPPDTNWFKVNNIQQDYPIINNRIYLALGFIDRSSLSFTLYANNSVFVTRNKHLANSSLVGVHSWANDPKILYNLGIYTNYMISRTIPEPSQIKNPTGGGSISGLAIANSKLYSSVYFTEAELMTDANDPYWRVGDINGPNPLPGKGAVQSNKMITDKNNSMILYGLYKGPYLRKRSIFGTYDQVYDLSQLNPTLEQGRIYSMVLTDDNHLLLGTATVNYSTEPPAFILYDLSENNPPRIVAKADGGQYATSLSYLPMADKHRFYGTVDDNRVFVFDVNRNQTSSDPIIQIETNHNSALYFYPTAVLSTKDSQTILLADCHHLWVYNTSQINYSNNYFPPTDTINSTFYGQFFHPYCGFPSTEGGYVPQLLEGNDSLIYGFYNGTIFHFDLRALDIRQSLKKYTIPGYNENTLGLEISVIAEDGTNPYNNDIYIGTRSGKIFILKDYSDIPVNLITFSASRDAKSVKLIWKTLSEENNRGFEIERSFNGVEWNSLAIIEGVGTTRFPSDYLYIDKVNSDSKLYYRYKQINFDGSYTYSNVIELDKIVPLNYGLEQNYPNPFNPTTNIDFRIPETGKVTIKIFDLLGNEIVTLLNEIKEVGTHSINFSADGLVSGIYFYTMRINNFQSQKKMVLIR
ncbi:MAG: T9SS type A sorting domain-containing protein, partial [Ignavibacteria bacterium]|nr:T9SS type A sorting domain-containing protein [Ignavibacteria bacterium]